MPELLRVFDAADGRPLAQAASVSPDGLPEVRTVVLRALGTEADACFASDLRSAKFASLAVRPWLELCLFDAASGVQWRVLGRTTTHAGDALALRVWAGLPADTRALYGAPPPGRPLGPAGEAGAATADPAPDPPAAFAVVRVAPVRCERLTLGPPLRRRRWTLDGTAWRVADVAP
jgi:hypothetical protein